MTLHDDEILGKAYDARLMRRLLAYLGRTGARSRSPSSPSSPAARRAGAAVLDQDRDRPVHRARAVRPVWTGWRSSTSCILRRGVRGRVRPDVDDAADRAADHVRPADGDLRASAAAGPAVLRPQSGRPPDDARHLGRRRAERSVHVGRRDHLRRCVHAGRHHGRDALDGLAAGAGRVLGAAADRPRSRNGSGATCGSRTGPSARGSRASTPSCRRTSPGCRPCSSSGAKR